MSISSPPRPACVRLPATQPAPVRRRERRRCAQHRRPQLAVSVPLRARCLLVFATLDQHAVYTVLPVRRGAWSAMRAAIRQRRHPRPCLYRGSVQCDTVVRGSSHGSSRFVTPLKVFKNLTTVVRFSFLLRQAFFSGYGHNPTRLDVFCPPRERGAGRACGRVRACMCSCSFTTLMITRPSLLTDRLATTRDVALW